MEIATKTITLAHLGEQADRYDLAAYAAELRETRSDVLVALFEDRIEITLVRGREDEINAWTDRVWERGKWASVAGEDRQLAVLY